MMEAAIIGYVPVKVINQRLGTSFKHGNVYIDDNVRHHVMNRHPVTYKRYTSDLHKIVQNPDYVGLHSKGTPSIELIKCWNDIVLVALMYRDDAFYITSFYKLDNGMEKIYDRLRMNRLYSLNEGKTRTENHNSAR